MTREDVVGALAGVGPLVIEQRRPIVRGRISPLLKLAMKLEKQLPLTMPIAIASNGSFRAQIIRGCASGFGTKCRHSFRGNTSEAAISAVCKILSGTKR